MSLVHSIIAINQELKEDREIVVEIQGKSVVGKSSLCSTFGLVTGQELFFDGVYDRVFKCGYTTDLNR